MIGEGGTINHDLLRDRTVIVVSDGIEDGTIMDSVLDFLKPVRTERVVVAAPVVSVAAVDKLHILADELFILDVKENYLDTNHYYEKNDVPSREETIDKINKII